MVRFPSFIIVEDDRTTKELLSIYLTNFGSVVAVNNGNETIIVGNTNVEMSVIGQS